MVVVGGLLVHHNTFHASAFTWSYVRDRARFVRLYGEIIPSFLTCTIISSVDLARYGVSRAKDWVSVDCGTIENRVLSSQGGSSVLVL